MVSQDKQTQQNPAWLYSPPDKFPSPPVITRAQTLPYHELSWENFERLILRVVRRETTIDECWAYGKRGQKQYGLDILAELLNAPGKFACYQCKRVDKFSTSDIEKAVAEFLKGKWASRTKRFVLCTSLHLTETQHVDEISKQRDILTARDIEFEIWDGSEAGRLSELLKKYPELVDDFFRRDWVNLFNGPDAAESLGERLDGGNLAELRTQLREIYTTLFHRNDQGIRSGFNQTIPLVDRYVPPTIIETREVSSNGGRSAEDITKLETPQYPEEQRLQIQDRSTQVATIQEIRISVEDWFSRHNRSVILGEPGFGKSALLRVTALQILNDFDEPFSLPWHALLPVWISFGGFSKAVQSKNDISLEDYFDQWLHQHGADHIRPLFRRAVKHGEILLLIDGLDESQDFHAAQQAMARLSTFLSIRPTPVILTSRPRGYTRLRPDGRWPLARLAPFDEAQIECFAYTWFTHLETPEVTDKKEPAWVAVSSEQRKEEFVKAIRANPRVMDLARTPLLCQLLIDVFRFSHHIPEQRVKVYDKVIELLLSDHPAARIQAAELTSAPDTPRLDDMREMLMRLALHIQEEGGAGVISTKDCQAVFCDFLTDDINGPGYSQYEAQHQAKYIIDYAQTGLGLVVERAPDELGFFHLTVQEYLAAQAMVRKEEKDQLDWLASVWDQPRWHEVVLAWFDIMGTGQGKGIAQRAITHLKQIAIAPLAQLQLLCLRTELAAGELGLSPREARATVEEAANEVETTPFPELRQELARHITLGLRSPSVASQCEKRLANWVPARPEWDRASLLETLGTWQMSEDLLSTLKIALHDESGRCRWAAAESLARAFASDTKVSEHLALLATNWPDTGVRAAALHGLGKGWPHHDKLNDLADVACRSTDMSLALTGISLRVASNRHDADDRKKLWFMISHGSVSFEMQDFCHEVLVHGWRKDQKIRELVVKALQERLQHGSIFEEERIISFLAESWPGDSEVARCIADRFSNISPSFFRHDLDIWKNLFMGFRGNKDLSSALRRYLLDRKSKYETIYWGPDTKWAYCVIGDNDAKMDVLKAYKSVSRDRDKNWVVSTLMEAWPKDSEVKELLSQEFHRPPEEVAFLSPWIDSTISDPEERRAWLLKALNESNHRFPNVTVYRLLSEFQDKECLEAVLAILNKKIWYYHKIAIQDQLITKFPQLPEVRQWAEASFFEIDGPSLASVAMGYEQDSLIHDRLLRAARPAKVNVRAEVFKVFREYSIPKDSALRLTEDIWVEERGEIHSAGVVARSIIASKSPELRVTLVTKLLEEMKSLGTYYEMRRRSAFTGLMQLSEYTHCLDTISEESQSSLDWLASYHETDVIATRILFEHLDKLYEASETQSRTLKIPWGALIYNGTAREGLSNKMARNQIIDYLKTMRPVDRSPRSLALMAELLPNSVELRTCLIQSIFRGRGNISYEAQRIFAEQFGGNEQAFIELQKFWNKRDKFPPTPEIHPPFLYALMLGWPNSSLLRPYLEQQELPQEFPLIAALTLSGLSGNESQSLHCIDRLIQITIENNRLLSDIYLKSLYDWARKPHAEKILRHLIDDQHTSRKITAIGMLCAIGKMTDEDRLLLHEKFDELLGDTSKHCPDGINLVDRTIMTLPQAIFRFLFSEANNEIGLR